VLWYQHKLSRFFNSHSYYKMLTLNLCYSCWSEFKLQATPRSEWINEMRGSRSLWLGVSISYASINYVLFITWMHNNIPKTIPFQHHWTGKHPLVCRNWQGMIPWLPHKQTVPSFVLRNITDTSGKKENYTNSGEESDLQTIVAPIYWNWCR